MEAKGGEVRRVHVVYFLSRMGRIEHPHLIRVHHLNRTGVHLRDVKRWLSDLRGKDMPDSFAWSYKRRYKTGYVWQDLLDDDLITPIADNEYVLKGSEISPFPFDSYACAEKTTVMPKPDPAEDQTQQQQPEKIPEPKIDVPCKTTETNIRTDGSFRRMVEFNLEEEDDDDKKGEERVIEEEPKEGVLDAGLEDEKTEEASKRSFGASFTRSKSHSGGASHVLRNLLSCRTVETNDSATIPINRRRKTTINSNTPQPNKGEIRKAERLSGSHRILNGAWNNQPQRNGRKSTSAGKRSKNTSESGNQKMASSAFKPVAEPNCSQCGKAFKPERLHAHMKSCKGLKTRSKGNAAEKLSQTTLEEELTTKEANPDFLLTR